MLHKIDANVILRTESINIGIDGVHLMVTFGLWTVVYGLVSMSREPGMVDVNVLASQIPWFWFPNRDCYHNHCLDGVAAAAVASENQSKNAYYSLSSISTRTLEEWTRFLCSQSRFIQKAVQKVA